MGFRSGPEKIAPLRASRLIWYTFQSNNKLICAKGSMFWRDRRARCLCSDSDRSLWVAMKEAVVSDESNEHYVVVAIGQYLQQRIKRNFSFVTYMGSEATICYRVFVNKLSKATMEKIFERLQFLKRGAFFMYAGQQMSIVNIFRLDILNERRAIYTGLSSCWQYCHVRILLFRTVCEHLLTVR